MRGFFTGLLILLCYAAICIVVLDYSFGDSLLPSTTTIIDSNNDVVDNKSFQSQDFEDTAAIETAIENDSIYSDSLLLNSTPSNLENLDLDVTELNSNPNAGGNLNKPATKFNISLPDGSPLLDCSVFTVVFKGQSRVKIPYECREYGIDIKAFLDKNPRTTLKITGYSDPSEPITTGSGRSEYLKKLLTNTGIPDSRIITTAATNNLSFESEAAKGGIVLEINGAMENRISNNTPTNETPVETPTTQTTTAALASKKFTSGFQGDYFYGDQKFTAFIASAKKLLSQNPQAKIYSYSYTDEDGNAEDNYAISRDNASTVRKILLQNGVSSNRIQSVAKGEQRSGTTGSNRCIIIVIK